MKKLFFIVAAACLLTATSCVNNSKKIRDLSGTAYCRSVGQ